MSWPESETWDEMVAGAKRRVAQRNRKSAERDRSVRHAPQYGVRDGNFAAEIKRVAPRAPKQMPWHRSDMAHPLFVADEPKLPQDDEA